MKSAESSPSLPDGSSGSLGSICFQTVFDLINKCVRPAEYYCLSGIAALGELSIE